MRVLMATIGTAGDVHPFIAVGLALRARGHEVVLVASPYFKDRVNAAGLGFWPVGSAEAYRAMVTDPDLVTPGKSTAFVYRALMLGPFREQYAGVVEAAKVTRAEVLVTHHIALGALAAGESLGLRTYTAVLAPMFWLSRQERLRLPMRVVGRLPLRTQLIVRRGLAPVSRWLYDRGVTALRREVGLGPMAGGLVMAARGGEDLNGRGPERGTWRATPLGLWSERFRPARRDDPSDGRICGFAVWDRPAPTPELRERYAEIAAWMEDGPAPVLVTLGSSVSHHGEDLYIAAAEACARLGRRALMLTGPEGEKRRWPEGVRAVDYLPYSIGMPRAACVVHHAGIGTTAGGLRAGKAAVIVPFVNDEFDNADRVVQLGAAVVVARRRAGAARLVRAIGHVLGDRSMLERCDALGLGLREEDGAAAATRAIEDGMGVGGAAARG